ncbi:hypothetical protein ABH926_003680 [Catenulispora sp. GP43]|uniref:hypothetical protein n=1 Tax=Catenulispora sp. GP43 TaxID=3156263 RepID=UPI0035145A2E
MEEKKTIPLPADPSAAGRKRTIAIAAGAVVAVAVGVVSVVAVAGGPSKPRKSTVGAAAATSTPGGYVTGSDGGYSQQPPQLTWSPRPGAPSPTTPTTATTASTSSSAPVAAPPPSGSAGNPSPPASAPPSTKAVPKPPASTVTAAPPPASTTKAPSQLQISGTISCVSGHSVEGVWVQASQGSGYSPWQGIGNGSTSRYWYTLPTTESFSLHVGCGGTTASWGVALTTPQTPGPVANFTCHDDAGSSEYGKCDLQ